MQMLTIYGNSGYTGEARPLTANSPW